MDGRSATPFATSALTMVAHARIDLSEKEAEALFALLVGNRAFDHESRFPGPWSCASRAVRCGNSKDARAARTMERRRGVRTRPLGQCMRPAEVHDVLRPANQGSI